MMFVDTERGAPRLERRDRLLILAFWTVFGLLESTSAFVNVRLATGQASWSNALVGNMPWWLAWAALTPIVIFVARRFRFDRDGWAPAAAAHFATAFVAVAVHTVVVGTMFYLTNTRGMVFPAGQPTTLDGPFFVQTLTGTYRNFLRTYLVVNLATYWVIVGGYYAFEFYRRYRQEELHAARMHASLTEARLNALRMELNPHFLFNTLNAISGLVRRRENDGAVRMLARLGDLLRLTLEHGGQHRVPLEQELELLRVYLEIEEVRFRDRLHVRVDVEPPALDGMVPTLILQPLVENAVKHGFQDSAGPATIRIAALRNNGDLILEVADSGRGFDAAPTAAPPPDAPNGVGLSNTRQRLAEMYGARAELRLGRAPEGGALVTVLLPFEAGGEAAVRA
jgi:two-component sensor histidine kinase